MIRHFSIKILTLLTFFIGSLPMRAYEDVTYLITNADLSDGFTGWNIGDYCSAGYGSFYYLNSSVPCNAECYWTQVDFSQTITGVDNGYYALSCYVFERPDYNGNYDGTEATMTRLFLNDTSVPVQHIMSSPVSEDAAVDGQNCNLTSYGMLDFLTGKGYVPNGMEGAAIAFGAGRYVQTVFGKVTDGRLQIGLNSDGQMVNWVIFAGFSLKYLGTEAIEMSKSQLAIKIDEVESFLTANRGSLKSVSITDLENALSQAKAILTSSTDTEEIWTAIDGLKEVKDSARFKFNPSNPQEPALNYKMHLSSRPTGIAWCNGDGSYESGTDVWISTSANNGNYVFDHWEIVGTNSKIFEESFYYKQPSHDVNMVAVYKYSPVNPAEPDALFRRHVFLKSEPEGVATFNQGNGERMLVGSECYVTAYGKSSYQFLGFYEGDTKVSDDPYYSFTMPDKDITLTARYRFNPSSPDDPSNFYSVSCILQVESEDERIAEVNVDGLEKGRAVYGREITLSLERHSDDVFYGWTDGHRILSLDESYTFMVTDEYKDVKIMALFSPFVANGDANGDGKVDITDVTAIVAYLTDRVPENFNQVAADADGNGIINLQDIRTIEARILNEP